MITITIQARQTDELTDLRNLSEVIDRTEKTYEQAPEANANWRRAVVCLEFAGDIMKDKQTSGNRLARIMRLAAWAFIGRAENAYKKFRQQEQLSQQNPTDS